MQGDSLVQCYNKGCGKKFDIENNTTEDCQYHPGPPFFHDAYKVWNCCKKKSTDFGTWLNYPGCTKGKHNPEKPPDMTKVPSSKEIRPEKDEEVIVWKGLNEPAARKTDNDSRKELALRIESSDSANAAIKKYLEENKNTGDTELKSGTPCRNNSCNKTYAGSEQTATPCVHHPGAAIFHEGMKYWSCCQKKTSDFGAFLDQRGCETGEHCWSKNESVDKLREDWFAANGFITINAYCRGALPNEISAHSDGQMLRVKLVHGFGSKDTSLTYDLFGEIIPNESVVVVGERKVEIRLKQADNVAWPRLQYEDPTGKKE